jgi:demethylmenaquinone methyltransferase/2-methoxy-6-polyprenyl-1,4-benzoquinol methylase
MNDLSRTFGYRSVDPDERERRIRRVFDSVAPRYDLMNDLMSFGIHRLWKRTFAAMVAPRAGEVIVDLAGGTGDVAALLAAKDRTVVVCDPSLAMMSAGRQRHDRGIAWLAGVGESLPFRDASIDALTISFGIRNATDVRAALADIRRVLKPGGRFLCLEFSRAAAPIRPFYDVFSHTVIPRLGAWIARSPESYGYLVESIRRFPDQHTFAAMIESAGFSAVRFRDLSFGIACIHSGLRAH